MLTRLLTALLLAALTTPNVVAKAPHPAPAAPKPSLFAAPLAPGQQIVHALNRLAFGPRPGDLERVRQMGLTRWINQQLSPESIPDTGVEQKLAGLTLLQAPPARLHLIYVSDVLGFIKNQQAANGGQDDGKPTLTRLRPAKTPRGQQMQDMFTAYVERAHIPYGTSVQTVGELENAKLTRAIESNRQLQEVLTDFWGNHFNVDVKKDAVRTYVIAQERDAIRPHVLGHFRDLLEATAKSPAMLTYLDNAASSRSGLNENYARELMELHTLGVDGGYTQKDVQEVARCLSGWSLNPLTGAFLFKPQAHDEGAKVVLGHPIPAGGGFGDGEAVLDILAAHPSTARFIAHELCVRFVADDPPPALVSRVAGVFLRTGGDLQATTRAVITSPEFFSQGAFRAKIKSPFEFAVSSVRAMGGDTTALDSANLLDRFRLVGDGNAATQDADGGRIAGRRPSLASEVAQMGQPLYSYQAPTGYSEDSQSWVSSGALIARLNFALALTARQVGGVSVSAPALLSDVPADNHQAVLDALGARLLGGALSPETQNTLRRQMPDGTPADPQKMVALVLGSPEFQRR